GDVTTSGSNVVTLATVATAGTNTKITYNAKGLVTSGTQAAASDLSNGTTGSGMIVLQTSPALTSPAISTIINTGTLTLPTSTDTLVGRSTTDTLNNKTLINSTTLFVDGTDNTKTINFQSSGATTGKSMTIASSQTTNRVLTLPDATDTLVVLAASQTLTNKSLTD